MWLTGVWAYAGLPSMKVNLPFEFIAGAERLPAGQYVISEVRESVVSLQAQDRGASVALLGNPIYTRDGEAPRMVFHKYGSHYVLKSVYSSVSGGITMLPSKVEKELKQVFGRPEVVALSVRV